MRICATGRYGKATRTQRIHDGNDASEQHDVVVLELVLRCESMVVDTPSGLGVAVHVHTRSKQRSTQLWLKGGQCPCCRRTADSAVAAKLRFKFRRESGIIS